MEFTEDEYNTLINALETATAKFNELANDLNAEVETLAQSGFDVQPDSRIAYKRICEQFRRQADAAQRLARKIENR